MSEEVVGTVLVVDDEEDIRLAIAMNAESMGYNVIEAGNGQEALEIVNSQEVDLVVSDLMMPKMSGLELLTQLRKDGCYLPFIIVTAFSSKESTIQALRLGAFDYLEKPFERDDVQRLLKQAMKVSLQEKDVESMIIDSANETPVFEEESDQKVALEIQKLSAMRFSTDDGEATEASPEPEVDSDSERLRDLFVSEVSTQLIFCGSAIKALESEKGRSSELGYLLRVMQAVHANAESIGAPKITEFAGLFADVYSLLKVYPDRINSDRIEVLWDATEVLRKELYAMLTHEPASAAECDEAIASVRAVYETMQSAA